MPFENSSWSSPESNLSASDFAKVCLINTNVGRQLVKGNMKLPVKKTPGGAYNIAALHAAAGVLCGSHGGLVDVPADEKRSAAKKLISLLKEAKESIPDALWAVAGEKKPAKE
jgi:hypothetical protein